MRRSTQAMILAGAIVAGVGVIVWFRSQTPRPDSGQASLPRGSLTFAEDIAPIIWARCAGCHRPGQAAPFSLLSYADVRKRAREIVEATENRLMPPWLPEAGNPGFADERRLTVEEIARIREWVAEGMKEGDLSRLPPQPQWVEGWQLGRPDLVVAMPEAYTLAPEGRDVYRSFVLPVPVAEARFVRAVEFQPDNAKVIHHAVMQLDSTSSSRLLDERDPDVGFSGIMVAGNAHPPDGHFLGWTPGKVPFRGREGMAWRLPPGSDLVLQLHLRPSGKPETIRAGVGLYFTDQPPARFPYSLVVRNKFIDIPPGEANHVVRQSYVLPVDVKVFSVYPHAHYLAREMRVWATLPDGAGQNLITIRDWDFNWQDEYRYVRPVSLPRGATIEMAYTYDNTADNTRNPSQPPRRVTYGRSSTDEMAEVLLQVLPATERDREILRNDVARRSLLEDITRHKERLRDDPDDVAEHLLVATRYRQLGMPGDALSHLQRAAQIQPDSVEAQFLLGDTLAQLGSFDEAVKALEAAARLDANRPETLNALARVLATIRSPGLRNPPRAVALASRAVELTGRQDPGILETLLVAYAEAGDLERAQKIADEAAALASKAGADDYAAQIRARLELYRNRSGQ